MREFFRGRRRKAGCVTLVIACALFALWVRSLTTYDAIEFDFSDARHTVFFFRGHGHWLRKDNTSGPSPKFSSEAHLRDAEQIIAINRLSYNRLPDPVEFSVPHFAIVIPLTLISAVLILWPQRKQRSAGSKPNA